ncbi:MAG: hypothetical protein FOGNACKC_02225 [Anaerolineae bacterium]|nr:hypothetical protein [Anaerolineae bacterium]
MNKLIDPNDVFGTMAMPETPESAREEIVIFTRWANYLEDAAKSARRRLVKLQQLAGAEVGQ